MELTLVSRLIAPLGACALVALLVGPNPQSGEASGSWPQWRGPDLDGISREAGWKVEGAEKPLWEKNVGVGYSTVSIEKGRLYTMGHDEEFEEDIVLCLDPKTGEMVWEFPFPAKIWAKYHRGGTLATPSIDGDNIFVFNREGNFFCLDAASGEPRWEKQLHDDFELVVPTWAFSCSPFVLEDMIVINVGIVLAYDRDGKLLWRTEKNYGHAYSTPALFDHDGTSCLAVFNGDGLVVLERKTGKELAFSEWKTRHDVNAATPVVIGDKIFISSGYNRGCTMLEFNGKELKTLWGSKVLRTQMSGPVFWEDHLYGVDSDSLKCIDLEGEEKWVLEDFGNGAILLADGKVVGLSDKGELIIAEATATEYKELSRKKVLDGGVYWTTPVLLDGLLYCRNSEGDMVCLDHRAKSD